MFFFFSLLPERPFGFICLRDRESFLCLGGREIFFVFVAAKVALSAGLLKFSLSAGIKVFFFACEAVKVSLSALSFKNFSFVLLGSKIVSVFCFLE